MIRMKNLNSLLIFTFALLSCLTMLCQAHNGKTAYAIPLSDIIIDGKLDDWPEDMIDYPIEWVSPFYYKNTPPDGPEDFKASFRIAYNPTKNTLLVAVVVTDDDVVVSQAENSKINNQDVCGIYIDADHSGGLHEIEIEGRQLYVMVPGQGKWTKGQDGNPSLNKGDTKASGLKGAFLRSGQSIFYEWEIPLFDAFPDKRHQIQVGKSIGIDFLVADADGKENANFILWTPEAGKSRNSDLFGQLIFIESYNDLATLSGTITRKKEKEPHAGLIIGLHQNDVLLERIETDSRGRYEFKLLPGEYSLKIVPGQGINPIEEKPVTVSAGQVAKADFNTSMISLPKTLEKSMDQYKALKGYRAFVSIKSTMEKVGINKQDTAHYIFAFEKPNRFRNENIIDASKGAQNLICSNGEKMVTYIGMWKQYTEKDVQKVWLETDLGAMQSLVAKTIIMSADPLRDMKMGMGEVLDQGQENLDNISTSIFKLMKSASSLGTTMFPNLKGEDIMIPVWLWIGQRDGLIHKMEYELDMDQMLKSMPEARQKQMSEMFGGMKISVTEKHTNIEIDPEFSQQEFTFIPPEGAKLVENFKPPGLSKPEVSKLLGKPAPEFALKDMDGVDAKLSDFAGKVVLVDFWATWCGPCVQAMPHIQALSEKYKDKNVVILGINSWENDQKKVEPFLREKKITYRILLDSNNEVIEDYGVRGIPTFFIIDRKGLVRYTYVGLPSDESLIQQNLDDLLKE